MLQCSTTDCTARWNDSIQLCHGDHKNLMWVHSRRWSIWGFMPLRSNIVLILSDSLSLQYTIHTTTGIVQNEWLTPEHFSAKLAKPYPITCTAISWISGLIYWLLNLLYTFVVMHRGSSKILCILFERCQMDFLHIHFAEQQMSSVALYPTKHENCVLCHHKI